MPTLFQQLSITANKYLFAYRFYRKSNYPKVSIGLIKTVNTIIQYVYDKSGEIESSINICY